VDASDFFNLPPTIPSGETIGAEYYQFKISVEKNSRIHTVGIKEVQMPATLRDLVTNLTEIARKKRYQSR
jgi:hypothetical protein